ncbi:ABC transporter ATP-binding protein [Devosia epidermidihirudinis]|uniref:ABC transporter ATP-binding protein n=2 Tax=Devosia epidermidihirudinis TaxID=1293439 RepID=A0A0F5QC42_9HYPH|nr:ABC transporter ATP-binding protein [Devosia epidermidihirudinis]
MSNMGATVRVSQLVKSYGEHVTAVDNANFEVRSGEFLSILGPSGSGKTSILMCLAGFEVPTAGRIHIGDRDVTDLPPNKREIGVIFQKYALFPHMTVRENIRFPLKMRGMTRAQSDVVVEEALATVRLTELANRMPAQLSGGQQQRVAIARAISFRPPLLLMDESLSALDKKLREEMQIEIKELQRKLGLTIIFVTHDQEEALSMSDRIAVMSRGRIEQIEAPDVIYAAPATRFVAGFVGESSQISGRIAGTTEQGGVSVSLDGGGSIDCRTAPHDRLEIGAPATVYLRPDHVTLGAAGGPDTMAAKILSKSFGGSAVSAIGELSNGTRIAIRLDPEEAKSVALDDVVHLSVQPGQSMAFAAEEGGR